MTESTSRLFGRRAKRTEGLHQDQGSDTLKSQAAFEADPRMRHPFTQVRSIPNEPSSEPAFSFAATAPLASSSSRTFPLPLSPSSPTSSLRYSDSSSSPSSSFHTSPPSPVTWRAERSWDVDPDKLDDEEVDILGALLPVVAEETERKSTLQLKPSSSPIQSHLHRSPSPSYSFPTTYHQLKHQQSNISNGSLASSSTRTIPNPHPSPIKPLPPIPPHSSTSSASSTSLEYLRHREPSSSNSMGVSDLRGAPEGNERTKSEVDGLDMMLRRVRVTSDELSKNDGKGRVVMSMNEDESKRTEKLNKLKAGRRGIGSWNRATDAEVAVESAAGRPREVIGEDSEEVLKSKPSEDEEDEDEFSLSLPIPRFQSSPASPQRLLTIPASPTSSTYQSQRLYRSSSICSNSSAFLPPPSSPPPNSPLPRIPSSFVDLSTDNPRKYSATPENSTGDSVSFAPTSPLPSDPRIHFDPAPSRRKYR